MGRLSKFISLHNNAHYRGIIKKLTSDEISLCKKFISSNVALGRSDFEIKLNRMFLDAEKPKHWKEICELLSCSNGARR